MCENGTETTPDQCKSLIPPYCNLNSISEISIRAVVICSESVQLNQIQDGDITIEISGPLAPYQFSYAIDETTGYEVGDIVISYLIEFTFETSLYGDNQDIISMTINNNTFIEDLDQNYLATDYSEITVPFPYYSLTEEEKRAAEQQSNSSVISLLLTFGSSFLIQFVFGSKIEASWILLGTLQMMSFLPLLNLNLPTIFREFSKNLSVLHGEPEAFPNIFKYYYDTLDLVIEPFNDFFEQMGFATSYILMNSGRKVMIWMAIGISMTLSFIMMDLFEDATGIGKYIKKIDVKLRYGFIIRAVCQSYLSLVLSSSLNAFSVSWTGNISVMSNMIAFIAVLVMMYIPTISYIIIQR